MEYQIRIASRQLCRVRDHLFNKNYIFFERKRLISISSIFLTKGFVSLKTIAELDPVALKVIKSNPDLKKKLINLNLPVSFEDFYLKTHIVYLEKNV